MHVTTVRRHHVAAPGNPVRSLLNRVRSYRDGHPRLLLALEGLYIAGFIGWLLISHTWPSPDVVVIGLLVLALLSAQGLRFLRDWTPFLVLLLAYVALPGVTPGLTSRVNVGFPIAIDRFLGGGELPTTRLQALFWSPNRLHWYDYMTAMLYLLHFIVPLVFAYLLWRWRRPLYWRFVWAYVALIAAGFVTYVVFPMAPPWWASNLGKIPTVHRVLSDVQWQGVSNPVVLLSRYFKTDEVAAMPSMHAAFPVLVFLVTWRLFPRWGWLTVLYPLAMAFAVIYAGEHYLVDVLGGWLYALAAFGLVWERWLGHWIHFRRPRAAAQSTRPVLTAAPVLVRAVPERRSPDRLNRAS
jgi:membrane-associated phospholipid phosphatase